MSDDPVLPATGTAVAGVDNGGVVSQVVRDDVAHLIQAEVLTLDDDAPHALGGLPDDLAYVVGQALIQGGAVTLTFAGDGIGDTFDDVAIPCPSGSTVALPYGEQLIHPRFTRVDSGDEPTVTVIYTR